MSTQILPNGTTWTGTRLIGHVFSGVNYDRRWHRILLPQGTELLDAVGRKWILDILPETELEPAAMFADDFSLKTVRIYGQTGTSDGGVGPLIVTSVTVLGNG